MNNKKIENQENKKFKMLNPKTDIVFQMLFSSINPEITKGLISSMIEENILTTTKRRTPLWWIKQSNMYSNNKWKNTKFKRTTSTY